MLLQNIKEYVSYVSMPSHLMIYKFKSTLTIMSSLQNKNKLSLQSPAIMTVSFKTLSLKYQLFHKCH